MVSILAVQGGRDTGKGSLLLTRNQDNPPQHGLRSLHSGVTAIISWGHFKPREAEKGGQPILGTSGKGS